MVLVTGLLAACSSSGVEKDPIGVGLLLSYSGSLAANSINSERALLMALDAGIANGAVGGRPLELVARDTGGGDTWATEATQQLIDAKVAILLGPDTPELAAQVRPLLSERTVLLPSFSTSSDILFKPASWFVMGPSTARVACELVGQLAADGRTNPAVVVNDNNGYNSALTWELARRSGMPKITLPADDSLTMEDVDRFIPAAGRESPDAYVLAALPASASSLVYALTAAGALTEPSRWYLSPTLHTQALLDTIPKRALEGARGVSPGTVGGSASFRERFARQWQDVPLDDAYPFYDAGAIAVLALERALRDEGAITESTNLNAHIRAVTGAGGTLVQWDEIDVGLRLLRRGGEVEYVGLSGTIQFDASGQTPLAAASTKWWTITDRGFKDLVSTSVCR
jgi:branched-chain amino acid transport system substrate-binding protein